MFLNLIKERSSTENDLRNLKMNNHHELQVGSLDREQ